MAYKPLSIVVLFVLASLLSASIPNEATSSDDVLIWQPLNPKDPKVLEIGEFAVDQHNFLARKPLKFISVISAEKQVDANRLVKYYRLVIAAADRGVVIPRSYRALLASEPLEKPLKLISFEPIED